MFLCTLILRISGNTKIYAFNCLLLIDSSNCNCASYDDRSFCGLGDRPGIRQTSGSGQQDHVVYPCAAPFASSQWQTHTWIRLFSSQLDPFVVTIRSIFSIRPDNMECKQFQGKVNLGFTFENAHNPNPRSRHQKYPSNHFSMFSSNNHNIFFQLCGKAFLVPRSSLVLIQCPCAHLFNSSTICPIQVSLGQLALQRNYVALTPYIIS